MTTEGFFPIESGYFQSKLEGVNFIFFVFDSSHIHFKTGCFHLEEDSTGLLSMVLGVTAQMLICSYARLLLEGIVKYLSLINNSARVNPRLRWVDPDPISMKATFNILQICLFIDEGHLLAIPRFKHNHSKQYQRYLSGIIISPPEQCGYKIRLHFLFLSCLH